MRHKLCCVYKLNFPELDLFYIGGTIDMYKRSQAHLRDLRNNCHCNKLVSNAWDLSPVIAFSVLERCSADSVVTAEERHLSEAANDPRLLTIGLAARGGDMYSRCPDRSVIQAKRSATQAAVLAEMTEAEKRVKWGKSGQSNPMYGRTHSAAARERIAEANRGRSGCLSPHWGVPKTAATKAKLSAKAKLRTGDKNGFFGREHTPETKETLRQANLGKLPPNTRRVRVLGIEYESGNAAASQLGIKAATLRHRCRSASPNFREWIYLS